MSAEQSVQANVSADFDTPDRILYGLTARQVSILAVASAVLWLAYHALTPMVPAAVFGIVALPVGGVTVAVALGRRDGISMDRWIAAAARGFRAPHRLVSASGGVPATPGWAPVLRASTAPGAARNAKGKAAVAAVAPLRLPARNIAVNGVIDIDGGRVALTAATTVNFDLRTVDEQHALVDGMGRWLNSLSAPVQIVISTRRVDMRAYAEQVEDRLDTLPHPALEDAAAGYAQFLRELAEDRDPLDRHVLIAHQVGAHTDANVARRQAEQTARVLTGLGAATRALDGGEVTDALVGACDPWRHVGTGRATPDAVITADPDGEPR